MIAFLTLCYCGLIWLVFFKLKLLRWDRAAQLGSVTVGVVAIFALVVLMGLFQPQSVDAAISQRVVPIVPRVGGRVIEVPIEPNVPLAKGDVLFRIDPEPYQAEVDRLEAALAEAEQDVPQLKAVWDEARSAREQATAERDLARIDFDRVSTAFERAAATDIELARRRAARDAAEAAVHRAEAAEERARLAYESQIGGVNTTVAQIRAQLERARFDLSECTVYAPADGMVTQLFVQPGAMAAPAAMSSVMSFIYTDDTWVRATFKTDAARHMRTGQVAEVVFDTVPGRVFQAEVFHIVPATGEGALTPGGQLWTTAQWTGEDLVVARIRVTDNMPDQPVPIGTGCTAAVYTDGAKAIRIIRKVVLRIQAWLNYL